MKRNDGELMAEFIGAGVDLVQTQVNGNPAVIGEDPEKVISQKCVDFDKKETKGMLLKE